MVSKTKIGRGIRLVVAMFMVGGLAMACTTQPAGPTITKVVGTCEDPGGLRLESSGFTPNGEYQTVAHYPKRAPYNGALYAYLANGGRGKADANGQLTHWNWDCLDGPGGVPDPEGVYSLEVIDLTTGKSAKTTFKVEYAPVVHQG